MKPKPKKPAEKPIVGQTFVPATTKALQAWKSELRRLETRLGEWANQLAERERVLEEQEAAFEAALDNADEKVVERYASTWEDAHGDECELTMDADGNVHADCGCLDTDAGAGCDCPKCQNTRANWVGGTDFTNYFTLHHGQQASPKQPVGDEVKWLENLWKLEDKRKKK
jgi:hypothetical protein